MKPMVILTGPTAVGKTELSIALARKIGGEIISADSMQVYKKMNIGTAKITPEEMEDIPHYLVDCLDPKEEFHVARFQQMAKDAVHKITQKKKVPLIVGGTGFYIQGLLYDIDFSQEEEDKTYRKELEEKARVHGNQMVHDMLKDVDPVSAEAIHPNNVKKVIRALEFYKNNKTPISAHNKKERAKESEYNFVYFVLTNEREVLYDRINGRVDLMIEQGLVDEVKSLRHEGYHKDMVSMQGIGYKEIFDYLEGACTLDEAIEQIKKNTRHFAKRQLTWFRREKEVCMVDKSKFANDEAILEYMEKKLEEKGIIHG